MNRLLLILALTLVGFNLKASEYFEFTLSSVATLGDIHLSTINLKTELTENIDSKSKEQSILKYVSTLVNALNDFNVFRESKNSEIQNVAKDLSKLTEDIVKECYGFIQQSNTDGKYDTEAFINKLDFTTSFYSHISLGVCMSLAMERPKKYRKQNDLQFINLTEAESDLIRELLISKFGESATKALDLPLENTSIELAARTILSYLNLEWHYILD